MKTEIKSRDFLFDNIKAIMLILVAFGHTIDPYIVSQDSLFRYLMQYIYLFHMPMFAFVSGYFTKNADKAREGAVKKILIPYVVIQCVYILMALVFMAVGAADYNQDVFKASLLLPTSPFYYLLCMFFWKIFLKDIQKLRFPIAFSVITGALISIVGNDGFHIGVGATFSLMLFFILGTMCTKEHVEKVRKLPKLVGVVIMLLGIIPATVLPYNFRNVRFTYSYVGLENGIGILYRLLFYVISVCMIVGIINLMPKKKTVFSRIGENSIIVYVGSCFAAPFGYLFIDKIFGLSANMWINLVAITIFCVFVGFFFSMQWIKKVYDWIMDLVLKIVLKEKNNAEK